MYLKMHYYTKVFFFVFSIIMYLKNALLDVLFSHFQSHISLKFQYYNQCQHTFSCLQMSLSRRKVTQYLHYRLKHILLMLCCTDTVLLTDCTSLHTLLTAAIGAPRSIKSFATFSWPYINAICSAVCPF